MHKQDSSAPVDEPFDCVSARDVNLPDSDGMVLAHEIRRRLPLGIIIVSERDTAEDRAMGLEMGTDDYITKPFFPRERLARVGHWLIDRENRKTVDEASGKPAPLTPAEV